MGFRRRRFATSGFLGYYPAALVTQKTETGSKRLLACSADGLDFRLRLQRSCEGALRGNRRVASSTRFFA